MSTFVKLLLAVALLSLLSYAGFSQGTELVFGINKGSFEMGELRSMQESLRKTLPVPAKAGETYPSFWGYGGHLGVNINRFQVGAYFAFNSTGSKLSYSDYSGTLYYDQEMQFRQLGASLHYSLSPKTRLQPSFLLEIGAGFTRYQFHRYFVLGDGRPDEEMLDFKAGGATVTPGISLKYVLLNRIVFRGDLKYLSDSSADFRLIKDPDVYLVDGKETVGPDWSGVRWSFMAGIRFHE